MLKITSLACLSLFVLRCIGQTASGLVPKKYLSLPLGTIKPAGWLSDQLKVQAAGLAGHEHEFYNYVSDSDWTGGTSAYSDIEEAGSYWFNGLVPTGVLAEDAAIKNQTQSFLDYVLDHQDSTGWIGPEVNTTKPRYLWGRYLFLLGAIQVVEADPSQADRVVGAIWKFVQLANTMLNNNNEGLEEWAEARWMEFALTLQWLYENYPNGQEDLLINMMQKLKSTGSPWEDIFAEANFPKSATDGMTSPFGDLSWHGVNIAEALKSFAVSYRFTQNSTELDVASAAWDIVFQYHGRPSGSFAADEFLAGLEAVRGSELCMVVETMFSGSYLYQVIGDLKYADRVERITYNALPATLTGNMWSRQYLQQQNQVAAKNMNPDPFPRDGSYSNVFGLEPNYPCCTVNHPQGWPKFVSNAFVVTSDQSSLVHVYLGPYSVNTTLSDNNHVAVTVDTLYPFSDTLTTTVTADKPFTYYIRIPSWTSNGTVSVNDSAVQAVSPSNGLQSVAVAAGTTKITLNLPAEITTEERPHGAIAVHRGALNYAFDIPRNQTVLAQNAQQPLAVDLQFDATAAWQYAINPSTLTFHVGTPEGGKLPSPVFDSGLSPFTISVSACPINWALAGDTFTAAPPQSPACIGSPVNITLSPYGTTRLRISEFPVYSA
ncbi:hypothetical protein L226DRAFT_533439 [Lentinus tigrinus ALCF2SS1-7]|uniref:uncharacterized protein n=1 Tax=Lentinus tigrinus ALCF2SS1-7 TaxID=1328758 RepID=UPI001165D14A|nr:hypothetical protein L226DRAFT_533439 [Lentinus tigrinus ALCF2SS1-7]